MSGPYITIFTDASLCNDTKVGAWACWVRHDEQRFLWAAPLKNKPKNPQEAELKAIANSLNMVIRTLQPRNKILVVATDSITAIEQIEDRNNQPPPKKGKGHVRRRRKWEQNKTLRDIAAMIRDSIPEGCKLQMRKVKAHSNKDGVRSWVNREVDRAAKNAMRKARKEELNNTKILTTNNEGKPL